MSNKKRPAARPLDAKSSTKISACLIVKNEEHHLPRSLASIRDLVDEIIVVDTGSTDRTIEIAEEFGAQIHHFEWCDDFSAARNESIRHATGDWIIWVDADDEVIEHEPGGLRRLCTTKPASKWGYWLDVESPSCNGDEVTVRHWRIFPNRRGIRFWGRIHEQPIAHGTVHLNEIDVQQELKVVHWGYSVDEEVLKLKATRNCKLIEQSIEEETIPGLRALHYSHLGRIQGWLKEYDNCLSNMERAMDLWFAAGKPEWATAHLMFSFAAQSALNQKKFDKAFEIEDRTPAGLVSAELLCLVGTACWQLERLDEATERFNRAWQDRSVAKPEFHDRTKSTWYPLLMLSRIHNHKNELEQAWEYIEKARAFAPHNPDIMIMAAFIAQRMNQHLPEAMAYIREYLASATDDKMRAQARRIMLDVAAAMLDHAASLEALEGDVLGLGDPERELVRAVVYEHMHDKQGQYDTLDAACRRFPWDTRVRFALVDFLTANELDGDAMKVLGVALDQSPVPPTVYRRLADLLLKQGQVADAANAMELYSVAALAA